MKRLVYIATGLMAICGMWSCGPSEKDMAEQARQDSIRIADSVRTIDSLRQIEEKRVADSIHAAEAADSIAKAKAASAKIDKKLDEYEKCLRDLEEGLNSGNMPPSASRAAYRFSVRVDEIYGPLKKMRSQMTPEQKSRFERIDHQLTRACQRWADMDTY